MSEPKTGSCLCGEITYVIDGPMNDITTCHCTQCRKQTGHHYAASKVRLEHYTISDPKGLLKWFRASEDAMRGFCSNCGSTLFWQADNSEYRSVLVGTIDGPTGLKLGKQIFADDKGDYYELSKDAPIHGQGG